MAGADDYGCITGPGHWPHTASQPAQPLRIYYPHQPGLSENECISVHSKLMVVDDRFLSIGSSNTSNRSMGLDTECYLAVEAKETDSAVREFIQSTRRRLFAEHLDCTPAQIAHAESKEIGLIVVAGVVFPGWEAFVYVFTGAVCSSVLGFLGEHFLSRGVIERLSGSRLDQLSKRLAERGTVAIALLRLVPIAPFAVLNLVAGASHVSFRQFIVASMLGLALGLAAITLFSTSLWGAITTPSWASVALAAGMGGALALLAWLVKRWLRSG